MPRKTRAKPYHAPPAKTAAVKPDCKPGDPTKVYPNPHVAKVTDDMASKIVKGIDTVEKGIAFAESALAKADGALTAMDIKGIGAVDQGMKFAEGALTRADGAMKVLDVMRNLFKRH